MSNDAARHELDEVLAVVQQQMVDLAAVRQQQAALTAVAAVADGAVKVTVNAAGQVVKTVIAKSYLEDFDLGDLGEHVTAAAQAAAGEVQRRAAELMRPLQERRTVLPSLSDLVDGAPDLRSLADELTHAPAVAAPRSDGCDGWDEPANVYPTVRDHR